MGNCSSGCRTQNHVSYGECMRSKNPRVVGANAAKGIGFNRTASKAWDKELDFYASAVRQGIQPASTRTPDIQQAVEASESLGRPWDAAKEHLVTAQEADSIKKAVDNATSRRR